MKKMNLRQAIEQADKIYVSVHMKEGSSIPLKISQKNARKISKEYLDAEFDEFGNIENETGSIIAYCDIPRLIQGYYTEIYLGR